MQRTLISRKAIVWKVLIHSYLVSRSWNVLPKLACFLKANLQAEGWWCLIMHLYTSTTTSTSPNVGSKAAYKGNMMLLDQTATSLKKIFFKCLFILERDRVWAGEGKRERHIHRIRSRLQAPSCQHRVRHRAQIHTLWDHDLGWSWLLNWLSHPGAPIQLLLN